MRVFGIVLAAGSGQRLGRGQNKALIALNGQALFLYALKAIRPKVDSLVLVCRADEQEQFKVLAEQAGLQVDLYVHGGQERRHSVEHALEALPRQQEGDDLVLVHDAARPFVSQELIDKIIEAAKTSGAAIPAIPVQDALRRQDEQGISQGVDRRALYQVQTPQGFSRKLLELAYQNSRAASVDDASLVEALGRPISLVQGDIRNFKITREEDVQMANQLLGRDIRMGQGHDIHRLVSGRPLILCGVNIPHSKGLLGHSDADAALHALMDALLGAAGLGDIGRHFPDTSDEYKGISSLSLLKRTREILKDAGFSPLQCDLCILAQRPRLAPYMEQMRQNIASALGMHKDLVNVKAGTTEGLGPEGREEGISALAIAQVLKG